MLQTIPGEKLAAEHDNDFERGYIVAVASVEVIFAQRQATRRAALNRERARNVVVSPQIREFAFQDHNPDPLSDDELSR